MFFNRGGISKKKFFLLFILFLLHSCRGGRRMHTRERERDYFRPAKSSRAAHTHARLHIIIVVFYA